MQRMLSLDDAAEALNVSKRHIRRLIAAKELTAYHVGRDKSRIVRVAEGDVLALLRPVNPDTAE